MISESKTEIDKSGQQKYSLSNWCLIILYLLFVLILLLQETQTLLLLNEESAALPSLFWRLLWPLSCLSLSLILPYKTGWFFLFFVGTFSSLFLIIDNIYYHFFSAVTSIMASVSVKQIWDIKDSITEVIHKEAIKSLFSLLFLFLLFPVLFANQQKKQNFFTNFASVSSVIQSRYFYAILLTICVISLRFIALRTPIYEDTHHIGREKWVDPADHWGSQYSGTVYAKTFGVFNYHVKDFFDYIDDKFHRKELTQEQQSDTLSFLTHKKQLNDTPSLFWGIAAGRNVVFLQMESWQHFLLDLTIAGKEVTPTLNKLKEKSLYWNSIMDVTFYGRTSDAEFAVMTGLLPDFRKPAVLHHLGSTTIALPKELKKIGYRTASFHGYNKTFWNRVYAHPEFGIDEMYFEKSYDPKQKLGLGASDPVVFKFVADYLKEQKNKKTFAFVISLSSHHPYIYIPKEYGGFFSSLIQEGGYGLIPHYLQSVYYADTALSDFMQMIEDDNLLEKTMFVIYGDHDRGGLGTNKPLPQIGPRMYQVVEDRIPLVIYIPGKENFVVQHRQVFVDATGGLHDLFPTILHLLGEETPVGVVGTHLFVPRELRDPIPLPTGPFFSYQNAVYGRDGHALINLESPPSQRAQPPEYERVFEEQLFVRDVLDYRLQRLLPSALLEFSSRGSHSSVD